MKKTEEIVGLPIISISDGNEVGKVKAVIINAEKGSIDYVVVDSGIQVLNARVISTEYVLGIGEYALTIENEDAINDISKIPAAIDLLQKNIQVKGTKVLTKKGRLIGEIGDIYIDEDENCFIAGLEYISQNSQESIRLIPRDSVITFGKKLVVVMEDVEAKLLDRASELTSDKTVGSGKSNEPVASGDIINNIESEADIHSEVSDMMELKHREYLKGKTVTKTIFDNEGNTLIEENTIIDEVIFDMAKANGKVIDLVMNNR